MDPMDKLAEALEHVHNVDVTDPNAGGNIIAGYEAIRTYSLAAIAHELHHIRRQHHADEAARIIRGLLYNDDERAPGEWEADAARFLSR